MAIFFFTEALKMTSEYVEMKIKESSMAKKNSTDYLFLTRPGSSRGLCHLGREFARLVFLSPSLYAVFGIEW